MKASITGTSEWSFGIGASGMYMTTMSFHVALIHVYRIIFESYVVIKRPASCVTAFSAIYLAKLTWLE